MKTQSSVLDEVRHRNIREVERCRAETQQRELRRRLTVVAPRTTDVVRGIGGWLCDQVLAGWDVSVIVGDPENVRAVRILGANVLDFESVMMAPVHSVWPDAVAVSTEMFRSDPRIRDGVMTMFGRGESAVTLWGDAAPEEVESQLGTTDYRLSFAARAFKRQALAAADIQGESFSVETLRRGGQSSLDVTGTPAQVPAAVG